MLNDGGDDESAREPVVGGGCAGAYAGGRLSRLVRGGHGDSHDARRPRSLYKQAASSW